MLGLHVPSINMYVCRKINKQRNMHATSLVLKNKPSYILLFFYVKSAPTCCLLVQNKGKTYWGWKFVGTCVGVWCNNLTKKMMTMKCAHKFEKLLYILIVGKMLLQLKPEKLNGYACKTQSAWGYHTNL